MNYQNIYLGLLILPQTFNFNPSKRRVERPFL